MDAFKRLSVEWGENSKKLARGLAALGPLFILARALTAAGQILAGRWLGPSEYGLATLVVASSTILFVPLQLGFSLAVVKFASMERNLQAQTEIVSTALWLNLAWEVPMICGLYLLREPLAAALRLPLPLYSWSLGYAAILSFYTVISGALQGILRFKERGAVELAYGASALALFILIYEAATQGYQGFVASLIAGLIVSCLASFYYLKGWIKPALTRKAFRSIASYAAPSIATYAAMAAVQSAAPLILGADLSAREVGYFGAYEFGSIGVALVLAQIVSSVLTPMASAPERQKGAWGKFFRLCLPLFAASFFFFCSTTFVMLKVLGRSYPVEGEWIALFSAGAAFCVLFSSACALLNARDARGVWEGTLGLITVGLANVAVSLWSIPRLGFSGAAVAGAASYAAGFFVCSFWGWRGLARRAA